MISEREAAKYPFLIDAVNLVKTVNPQLEELSNPNYMKALKRGAERVIEAIISREVSINLSNPIIELLSFPIANMFVTIIGDEFLSRRYALSEAVRIYKLLVEESEERIIQIATQELSWDIHLDRSTIDGQSFNYSLSFNDYLNAASGFREKKWKPAAAGRPRASARRVRGCGRRARPGRPRLPAARATGARRSCSAGHSSSPPTTRSG